MEKITYVSVMTKVVNGSALTADEMEKAKALLESLSKKASAERKPTKAQKENATLADSILAEMEIGKAYRISDMVASFTCVEGLSPNKVSALVRTLKDSHKIERFEEKRVAYFRKNIAE